MYQTVKFVTIYGVKGGGDEMGRNQHIISFYKTHASASENTKGVGAWGSDGSVVERKAVAIEHPQGPTQYYLLEHDTPLDLDNEQRMADEKLRKETLALLSDEQKRVLKIDDR